MREEEKTEKLISIGKVIEMETERLLRLGEKDKEEIKSLERDWGPGISIEHKKILEGDITRTPQQQVEWDNLVKERLVDDDRGVMYNPPSINISKKARDSRRYYIRRRKREGKPYIPLNIRMLGKFEAKALGYTDWERRDPIKEEKNRIDSIRMKYENSLRVFMSLVVKTRIRFYLEKDFEFHSPPLQDKEAEDKIWI